MKRIVVFSAVILCGCTHTVVIRNFAVPPPPAVPAPAAPDRSGRATILHLQKARVCLDDIFSGIKQAHKELDKSHTQPPPEQADGITNRLVEGLSRIAKSGDELTRIEYTPETAFFAIECNALIRATNEIPTSLIPEARGIFSGGDSAYIESHLQKIEQMTLSLEARHKELSSKYVKHR